MPKNSLTILLYHGVCRKPPTALENASGKHMPADEFEAQMSRISKNYTLLSMQEALEIYESGRDYPDKAVAVTFDDGFANNAEVAAPILKKYGIPTTFYLSPGIIDTQSMFWVDEIEDMILRSREEKIELRLDADSAISLASDSEKLAAIDSIKGYCKKSSNSEKDRVLENLRRATGVSPSSIGTENYRVLSWSQVKDLASEPLFIIGGHSSHHRILSSLSPSEMRAEIDESLSLLERHCGHSISHYSYPEGQPNHFNDDVIGHLKKRGVRCCPTAIHGITTPDLDPFHWKRVMVGFKGTQFPL